MLEKIRRLLVGPPRDIKDPHTFHAVSLVALLAWVGLGADGLSSSAYGPDEAFRALGTHTSFAAVLALATALTVFIISYGYSRIIEHFPTGGGYVVASKLLGPRFGVVSGAALLVDYVLTISVSIASGADAVFSFLPERWAHAKLPSKLVALTLLTVLNLRGAKESITTLLPIFLAFLVTHAALLLKVIGGHAREVPREAPVAVFFVGSYNGLGRHAVLKLLAMFPGHFQGAIFVSVAVVDSGVFKGADEVEALDHYVDFARRLGLPASAQCKVGTEVPATSEAIAREVLARHPRAIFVSGNLLFETDSFFTRPLHNETAFAVQSRLQRGGIPMVVLPVRVTLGPQPRVAA